jgi:Ser/Thr protein kinase RdoA (MazF antagonist)
MTAGDGALLQRVNDVSRTWDVLLGTELAELLASLWPVLISEWDMLSAAKLIGGRTQAAHFDLHPHNLLVSGGKVAAVLDFEACKVMPVGFALGFAALKQCRQAIALRQLPGDPRLAGALYIEHLFRAYHGARELAAHLGDLAVAETLRRICIILRLNLENGEKKWNKVLAVQLGHLGEARELFG